MNYLKISKVQVPGGIAVKTDLFHPHLKFPKFHCAVLDPSYGPNIFKASWGKMTTGRLVFFISRVFGTLADSAVKGSHAWLWGGIGTPGDRVLYRTLLQVESSTEWQMAEQITWRKKRAYGTNWRCLMNREECLRFVLGDPKKPRFYKPQLTEELRGYKGFNSKHPAKSKFKRLTMVWDHASDMGKKPHPCFKPGPLCASQILSTTKKGDTVLELFAGSGQLSITARELGRKFVAFESDPEQFDLLVERLRA